VGLTVCRRWSRCGHGAKIVEPIVELHGICHHGCFRLGGRNVLGVLAGSYMWAKAPAAGGSGEPRAIVAEQHQEGGGAVGGWKGRAWSQRVLASSIREYGFM
jgi:hypothetical protein